MFNGHKLMGLITISLGAGILLLLLFPLKLILFALGILIIWLGIRIVTC